MEDPVLTWFDCSKCPHSFHIGAAHRDAVEAHHRKLAHAGDTAAVLVDRSESVEDGTEGGYTAYPAGHPEAYQSYRARKAVEDPMTPEEIRLAKTLVWGVRMPDGDLHYGLSQGDAENLAVITDGQLVAWVNDGWEDQE